MEISDLCKIANFVIDQKEKTKEGDKERKEEEREETSSKEGRPENVHNHWKWQEILCLGFPYVPVLAQGK